MLKEAEVYVFLLLNNNFFLFFSGLSDAISICHQTLQSKNVNLVPGAGAVEAFAACAVRRASKQFADVRKETFQTFATCLEVIPSMLISNAKSSTGIPAHQVISLLKKEHLQNRVNTGIDVQGNLCDAWKNGIVEPYFMKEHVLMNALEAFCAIIKIDCIVMEGPPQQQQQQKQDNVQKDEKSTLGYVDDEFIDDENQ